MSGGEEKEFRDDQAETLEDLGVSQILGDAKGEAPQKLPNPKKATNPNVVPANAGPTKPTAVPKGDGAASKTQPGRDIAAGGPEEAKMIEGTEEADEDRYVAPDLQKWDPNLNFDNLEEEEEIPGELTEIDPSENVEALETETQTPGNDLLSFEDPRFFSLDLSKKKLRDIRAASMVDGENVPDYLPKKGDGEEEMEEDVVEEEEEEEETVEQSPQMVLSSEDFKDLYVMSDSCLERRLSAEVARYPSLHSTPSPPGTPKSSPRMNRCPSVESFFKLAEKITIHFHILPGKKLYSRDVRLDQKISNVKDELSKVVKVPAKYLDLRRNKKLVMDYKSLKDCGGQPGKKLRFTVEVTKKAKGKWELYIPLDRKLPPRPDIVRKVKVPTEMHILQVICVPETGFGWKTINVTISFPTDRKLFLGGYRHKITNAEYHHAYTQTPHVKKEMRETQKNKATQAFHESENCMNTLVTTYTQVDRPDYYVSCRKERWIRARKYITAAQLERLRERAAIIIQRYWRRWLAIKEKEDRMLGLIKRVEWAEQIRKGRIEVRLAIKDDELYRQYNPKTLLDIELLYRAINQWRKQEVDYVLMNRWGAEKKAALADIMEKEADLLLDLERAKSKIINEKNKHLVEDLFAKMGRPTRFLSRTGHFITLDNPGKEQVRVYRDLYDDLKKPVDDPNGRLELLSQLYKLIKNHKTPTSEYLIQLIGREIALMERKARIRVLGGIRKRILHSFFALCRDPRFNPESKKIQKVPFDSMKLRKDMVQCNGCKKMMYRDQFTISRGVTVTNWCLTCMGIYRTCILRVDMNLYRRMLQELRQDEQEQGVDASTAYVIDAYDLQFLIEQIWHGQSALSGIDDKYLLRLCRWIKTKPWTPWNCVLLTEAEAVAHLHIEDMTIAYQPSFFEKVCLRHNTARSYFQRTSKLSLALDPNLQNLCLDREDEKKELRRQKMLDTKKFSMLNL